MKSSFVAHGPIALFVAFTLLSGKAQTRGQVEHPPPLLTVDSAFVWVPALVKSRNGYPLSHPDISRFRLLDNGAPEKVTLINTGGLPVSLVILMQTGGSASSFLSSYTNLPELIGPFIGDAVHEIALVAFDSHVEEIWRFPTRTDGVDYAITHQPPGDTGAAIKDALAFGVRQFQSEPGQFRRIILLLSQRSDVGSSTSSRSLLEQLGTSSTVIYSLTFPGENSPRRRRAKKDTAATDNTLRTVQALNDQTAEEVAYLTGGDAFQFNDRSGFDAALLQTISDFHYAITLGFQPYSDEIGLHFIEVQSGSPGLRLSARRAYWREHPE